VIKARGMRWTGFVESVEEMENICYTKLWSENLKVRGHLGNLGVDGSITLKWILKSIL
jgi:hypothetical protein